MTEECRDWLDLLDTAKQIRRSVRPVTPSPVFRRHLSSDLATRLSARRSSSTFDNARSALTPGLVLGVALGLTAIALSLISLRAVSRSRR
jgi:hypothetical protein